MDRTEKSETHLEDYVSGVLYDLLQKEVITLRKACHEKDQSLKDKDDAIEVRYNNVVAASIIWFIFLLINFFDFKCKIEQMLAKKVDTLNKAMEVESRKMRREVAAMEKEVAAMRIDKEVDQQTRRTSAPRVAVNSPQLLSAR